MSALHHAALRRMGLIIAATVLVVDQALKWLMTGPLDLRNVGHIELIPLFDLTYTENRGVSLGLLTADTDTGRWLLVAMTLAISAGVVVWLWRERNRLDVIALGLILGGALGNIVDRATLGYVVDFADLHFGSFRPFMIFNLADAAISIGVVLLLARALLLRDKPADTESTPETKTGPSVTESS